jgi:hypothetical protein
MKIFNRDFKEIQDMQMGAHKHKLVDVNSEVDLSMIESDKQLLYDNGLNWLVKNKFYGCLDRLKIVGLISENDIKKEEEKDD